MKLQDFANKHQGEVAYVIGSGNTCTFFDPSFFTDKLTVGVNSGWAQWLPKVQYMLTKYHHMAEEWVGSERIETLLVSKGHTGQLDQVMEKRKDMLVFDHAFNRVQDFTAVDFPDSNLVVSYSSITSAIHFAAILGASAIITVGADCGWIDDKGNVGDYRQSMVDDLAYYFELQNRIIAHEIRTRYNIPVMSLLPFITPNMEGHKFTSPFGALNAT
jgi:thiol-disulfide isomerase/thioredoxin